MLNRVVQSVGSLLGAKAVSIYLVDPSSQTIVVCASNEDGLTGFPVAFGEGIAGITTMMLPLLSRLYLIPILTYISQSYSTN